MAHVSLYIAWRYLFSKKGHNAINIISGVSATAVCVVTAAMICVLSVMNGFGDLVEHMFSEFDPEIQITSSNSKYFRTDSLPVQQLRSLPYIQAVSSTVEETALVRYKDHQMPATLMGVDTVFRTITHIDSILSDGFYSVNDGAFDRAVLGRGLAAELGMNAHFVGAIHLYAPKRLEKVNVLRPDESFCHEVAYIAGTFAVNQVEYDDKLMLVSLDQARRLFEYDSVSVTSLSLQLVPGTSMALAKREMRRVLGNGFEVKDRYEQQADFYRILKIEKLLTFLLLAFILLIACFNVIGSLSMLIIDKSNDIRVLSDLGATPALIRRIFLYEGWLITSFGALIGIILGIGICHLQQYYGILKLGTGEEYVISAYPVAVESMDVIMVLVVVLLLGFVSAWYPTHKMKIES